MTARDDARTKRRRATRTMREWRNDGLSNPCRDCGEPFDHHGMIMLPSYAMSDDEVIQCAAVTP